MKISSESLDTFREQIELICSNREELCTKEDLFRAMHALGDLLASNRD